MKRGEYKERAAIIARTSYVKKSDGHLAVALSAMNIWEARALVAQTREFLQRLPVQAPKRAD